MSWVEEGTTGVASDSGEDIVGKLFDAEGNVVKDSFQLNTRVTDGDQDDLEVVPTGDGGFAISYRSTDTNGDRTIVREHFDSIGNQVFSVLTTVVQPIDGNNPQIVMNFDTGTGVQSFETFLPDGSDANI